MEIEKNDDIEVTVESLGYRGEGVARIDRVPVFIAGALAGERVRAHVILVKKDYAVAKLTEVLSPSPERREPRCRYFGKCGGCSLQHMDYAAGLRFKRGAVADALRKIAHCDAEVAECVPSDAEYGYRNKLSLPVRRGAGGAEVGLFAYNSHRVVQIDDCPLQTERVRKMIPLLREAAGKFEPYDETSGRGELRHFVVRDMSGGVSLTVVAARDVTDKVRAAFSGIGASEVWLNINSGRDNVIMGDKTKLVLGERRPHEAAGLSAYVHPRGFMQVNDGVMRKLYAAVIERVKGIGAERIIDAYSGGGVLTALLAPSAKEIVGVEIERAAVDSAVELARANGVTNARHICGDCAKVLPRLIASGTSSGMGADTQAEPIKQEDMRKNTQACAVGTADACSACGAKGGAGTLIILDPPRSGCDRAVTEAVNNAEATVLYISCNPSTLARDLALLGNYVPTEILPFDMFPQTPHVETLVVLKRK